MIKKKFLIILSSVFMVGFFLYFMFYNGEFFQNKGDIEDFSQKTISSDNSIDIGEIQEKAHTMTLEEIDDIIEDIEKEIEKLKNELNDK